MNSSLTPREIADQLSLREFLRICAYFDGIKRQGQSKTVTRTTHGYENFQTMGIVGEQSPRAMFDVLAVERNGNDLFVTCIGEDGRRTRLDMYGKKNKVA